MGIATVGDLLDHLPREYIDFSEPVNIADAPLNEQAVVSGTVTAKIPAARIRQGWCFTRSYLMTARTQ